MSSPGLDRLAEAARAAGALGARLSGGGFAGCVVALVPRARAEAIARGIGDRCRREAAMQARLRTFLPADAAREWTEA